jgi:hypothetical protein
MKTFYHFALGFILCVGSSLLAAVNVEPIEKLIADGKPTEALAMLDKELAKRPADPRLLYNFGVASYAAGKYDDALLAFDKVETSRNLSLAAKARAQKGNAEFHLGLNSKADNLDETIERWKTALDNYKGALKQSPRDAMSKSNHDTVQKLLMEILLRNAQQKLDAGLKDNAAERRIETLRDAMEKFQEAKQVDAQSEPAKLGEQTAREELAKTLAKEGEKHATPRQEQPLQQQVTQIEKGVNMLEDANQLLPEDKQIQEQLNKAKETLAQALTERAKQEIQQAKESSYDREKFAKLDKAVEDAQQAQDFSPKNEEAKKTEQEAKDELAKLHEQTGDRFAQQAEHASLPQQVDQLENAVEHYQAAEELKPDDQPLEAKTEQTEEKLAEALQKLADRLLQEPPRPERVEETVARYEQAESTLQDLEQLRPSPKTEQQLSQVEQRLAMLRQRMADEARLQLAKEQQAQKQNQAQKSKQPQQAQTQEPPELEQPPEKPQKGGEKSNALAKKGKDY